MYIRRPQEAMPSCDPRFVDSARANRTRLLRQTFSRKASFRARRDRRGAFKIFSPVKAGVAGKLEVEDDTSREPGLALHSVIKMRI